MKKILLIALLFGIKKSDAQICLSSANYYGAGGSSPYCVISSDFNNDGKIDLASANLGSNNVGVVLGVGDGTFNSTTVYSVGSGPSVLTSADFNNDGKKDLATSNNFDNNVSILLGDGTGGFASAVNYTVGINPVFITNADVNSDSKPDLIVANMNDNNVAILLGVGNGTFSAGTYFAAGNNPASVVCKDFNGDGKIDLAVANDNVSVLLGNGNGTFGTPTTFLAGNLPNSIVSADYNSDGKADLAVANINSNDVSILLGAGNGTFGAATSVAVGSGPYALCTGNFNNDTKADIAVANYNSNNISVLEGNGNGTFAPAIILTGVTNPTYVMSADFNGDSKNDLAAVDIGFFDVFLSTLPSAIISGNTTICIGSSTILTGSGADNFFWSANAQNSTANTVTVSPTTNTTYTLNTYNFNCIDTARSTITLSTSTPSAPSICLVTVDSTSTNNIIVWDKTLYPSADTFYIYRDTANNAYGLVGKVSADSISMFIDKARTLYGANGDPNASSWRYKLAYTDSCSTNLSPLSLYHQSMFMQNNTGNFSWNHYAIEGQSQPVPALSNYLFKRDDNATGVWVTIQNLSASSMAYTDAQYGTFQTTADWRVETQWSTICTPTLRLGNNNVQTAIIKSRSNVKNNRTTELSKRSFINSLTIFPNPANNEVSIQLNKECNNCILEITNAIGQIITTEKLSSLENKINVTAFANGVYYIKVKSDNKANYVQKLIVQH